MKRAPMVLAAVLIVIALGALIAVNASGDERGPIYSVEQVNAGLLRDPGAWLGKTIRVHGIITFDTPVPMCPAFSQARCDSPTPTYVLFAPDVIRDGDVGTVVLLNQSLLLIATGANPLLEVLHTLPLLSLAASGQQIHAHQDAVYRIRLQATQVSHAACTSTSCFQAMLLDASPQARTVPQIGS